MAANEASARPLEPMDFGIGQLFELIPDAVIIGDALTGRVVLWNPGAAEVFGYPYVQAPNLLLEDLVADELKEAHRLGIERYARGEPAPLVETRQAVELPAQRRGGERIWVELRLTRLRQQPDNAAYVLAVVRDVTERRSLQDAIESSAAADAERAESLRSFFSMAAHDIQNPLMVVTGVLDAVAQLVADEEDVAGLIAVAARQSNHLSQLVADIMTMARLETGAMAASPTPTDLRTDVLEAVDGHVVGVDVRVPADLVVLADRTHVVRIVHNLAANALKHGSAPVVVDARHDAGGVRLEVRDAGAGVAADVIDRLFEPFVRSDQTQAPGNGLGLAAVRKLAELNGGRAWYDADADGGAAFCVWLPTGTGAAPS